MHRRAGVKMHHGWTDLSLARLRINVPNSAKTPTLRTARLQGSGTTEGCAVTDLAETSTLKNPGPPSVAKSELALILLNGTVLKSICAKVSSDPETMYCPSGRMPSSSPNWATAPDFSSKRPAPCWIPPKATPMPVSENGGGSGTAGGAELTGLKLRMLAVAFTAATGSGEVESWLAVTSWPTNTPCSATSQPSGASVS